MEVHLPGVPHVFTDYQGLVGFLRNSPGYVKAQHQFLTRYWSGALHAAGYTLPTVKPVAPVKQAPRPVRAPVKAQPQAQSDLKRLGFVKASEKAQAPRPLGPPNPRLRASQQAYIKQVAPPQPAPLHIGFDAQAGLGGGVKALSEIGQAVTGLPAGVALTVQHPLLAAKLTAKGFEESAQHPLRHPGFTALNLLALGSLGAGAAAKVGDVGRAGSLGEAARVAVRPARSAPRELDLGGGVKVQRFPSRNVLTQKVLAGRDRALQEQLDGGGAPVPPGRNVLSPQGTGGRELSRQHEIRLAQRTASAKAFERFGHGPEKLTAAEEKAFETIARGHSPETMVQHHLNGAAKQAERGDMAAAQAHGEGAVLAQAAADLIRNPSEHLSKAVSEGRALIEQRQRDLGMTEDEIAHSIGKAHDEIAALAEGRQSLSQRLAKAEADVTTEAPKDLGKALREAEAKLAANRAQQAKFKPPPRTAERGVVSRQVIDRPRTRAEAEQRLAAIEASWERLVGHAVAQQKGELPFDPAETLYRNEARYRAGRRGKGYVEGRGAMGKGPPTQAQELRQRVEDQIISLAENNRGKPFADHLLAQLDEASQLRAQINETHPVFGSGEPGDFGNVRTVKRVQPKGLKADATLRKLRREESDLSSHLDELRRHEKINAVHDQITAVGKEAQKKGAFYLKTARFPDLRGGPPAVQRSPGPSGFGPPKIPRMKSYSGGAQRRGVYRTDVVNLIAESSRQASRIAHARDYSWPTLRKLAKGTQEEAGGKYAVPIREKTKISAELRDQLAHAHNPKEFPEAHQAQLEDLMRHINPPAHLVDEATNTIRGTTEEIKWVDSRLAHGLLTRNAPGFTRMGGKTVNVGSVLDTLNAPARFATLFAKPSYYWNRVQQALQNASQQGLFLPANGTLLKRVAAENPVQDYYTIKSLAGTGRSRAIIPEGGPARELMTRGAQWWSKITDDKSRELSFIHEARREGFDTPEKIHALLTEPKNQAALERVAIRGRHEAIPFGKMSPIEKETIGRAFFFYPWTRAAIEFTARFPGEHPVQAALGTQVGRQGEAETQKIFQRIAGAEAHLPEWAKALVFFQSHGAHPLSSDFSNLNTPQTAVDTGQMLANLTKKPTQQTGQTVAGELGPLLAAGYGLASGTNRNRSASSALAGAAGGYAGSTPFSTFQRRLKGTGTYPGGLLPATLGYLGGPEVPRPTGAEALAAGGEKERRAQLDPVQRVQDDSRLDQANLRAALVKAGYTEYKAKLTPQLVQAFSERSARRAALAKAGIKPGTGTYQHDAWKVDVATLLERGEIDKATAATALAWGAKETEDKIKAERARLGQEYFGGSAITDVVELLHEKGIHYSYR